MTSRRNFNPAVRTLLRKKLDIPQFETIPECSWPQRAEDCKLSIGKNLISSSVKRESNKYEVRSISNIPEPNECAIGPEFHGLFENEQDTRSLLEALVDAEVKLGNVNKNEKGRILKDIGEVIKDDITRRRYLLLIYVVYFIVSGFLLSYNYQNFVNVEDLGLFNDRNILLALYLVPLLTIFFLHNKFGERVRTGNIFHVIPLALIGLYILQMRIYQDGVVTSGHRLVQILVGLVAIVLSVYLLMRFRTIFENCSAYQLNHRIDSTVYLVVGTLGLLAPLLILSGVYLTLINTSNNP